MHGNSNFERTTRKERNERPPRGNQHERQQAPKRGKTWERDSSKRNWDSFDSFQ